MTQEIDIRLDNGVQIIRLMRADKKNALTGPMYEAMSAALEEAEKSDAIAAHVFMGSGGVFTAGNDINDFVRRAQDGSQHAAPSQMFIGRLPKVTRPMIAAVDGLAVGIGVTLLLHCDLVYATPTASFRAPFVDLGLIQEAGSSLLGPARLGYARAFELLALGEVWTAERAAQAGLINAVVGEGELEAKALAAARRLAAKPRAALLASRRMLKGDPALASKAIADELAVYKDLIRSPEAREAFTAFLEKRAPDFVKARRGAASAGSRP
ncbi:MAG TPA: enoyl-CoA hydratase-related protein [Hyphomicrobiaceae bacterium]|nr:enoyl-CoA hydratase-related protein [Hyphomicrobiaceae bacterium]